MKQPKQPLETRFRSVYTVVAGGKVVLDVQLPALDWLPVRPRINPNFVRPLADAAVQHALSAR